MGWTGYAVRPRVTELVQIGIVECVGERDRQGVYEAISQAEWERRESERGSRNAEGGRAGGTHGEQMLFKVG